MSAPNFNDTPEFHQNGSFQTYVLLFWTIIFRLKISDSFPSSDDTQFMAAPLSSITTPLVVSHYLV